MRVRRTKKQGDMLALNLIQRLGLTDREFRIYCWFLVVNPTYEFTNVTLAEVMGLTRRQVEFIKKKLIDHELVLTDRISQHEFILYIGNENNTALEVREEYTSKPMRHFAKIDSDKYPAITSEYA